MSRRWRAPSCRPPPALPGSPFQRHRRPDGVPEQPAHAAPVLLVEAPESVVVRVLPSGQPQVGQLVAAVPL